MSSVPFAFLGPEDEETFEDMYCLEIEHDDVLLLIVEALFIAF